MSHLEPARDGNELSRFDEEFGKYIPEYVEPRHLLENALARLRTVLDVDTATVLRYDARSNRLVAVASSGIEEEVYQGVRIPFGSGFAGRIAAALRPLTLDHVDRDTVINPLLWEHGLRSLLGVPMVSYGRLLGVLHVGSITGRVFTPSDIRILERVGERLAHSVYFATLGEEHTATLALQRSLLPAALPEVRGLEVATRYVPGADAGLGGDWYDLFPLPEDRVGLVMGDVAGHGLEASVVMGRIRSALRAYALEWSADPARVLERVDAKMHHFEPGVMATIAYGVLDASRRKLTLSLAGHPPPIRTNDDGSTFLAIDPDLPIGLFPGVPRANTEFLLADHDAIALYTDGLVERRGESMDLGLRRLCMAMTNGEPEAACARVMSRLVGPHAPRDDVALLIARCVPFDAPQMS
ncbi:PP2C family protein-serine/threonine phosphatase [Smaragdicoccus niigatensis]|uniref:PP2C family protein-serine/threonine phosphatase n=1 Tax=Smaragdicoccus niigatensis TaxID=359359 RepID=UPI000381C5D5|nr:GAF domain-containing SpoIIE family protein phosphatase [Smaragdicoccus niigatensis]